MANSLGVDSHQKRKQAHHASTVPERKRFGGRAGAAGSDYESKVAAFAAVQMLAGNVVNLWDWAGGDEVESIALQSADAVDDVVVTKRGSPDSPALVQAKGWTKTVAVSETTKVFVEVIDAFARQFAAAPNDSRGDLRLIWAVPSTVGARVMHDLVTLLNAHRDHAEDAPLNPFRRNRTASERRVMQPLEQVAMHALRTAVGRKPSEQEFRTFLRAIFVEVLDFGHGHYHDRIARDVIRQHIADRPAEADRIWKRLVGIFADANVRGLAQTAASLRRRLTADSIILKAAPGVSADIQFLRELTERNLHSLANHAALKFGPAAVVHVNRATELAALQAASKGEHLLLTGDPGCGKSGLLHDLALSLVKDGVPVVLLLAEEAFDGSTAVPAGALPGLQRALDRVLSEWPNGGQGILITDALDSVRDAEVSRLIRRLLSSVLSGKSGWKVLASVREFDLRCGRELRELFPGSGVADHAHHDFTGVAHFHLAGLRDAEVEWIAQQQPALRLFVESAARNPKSSGLQRSPFYLRLAAELLASGVAPTRLADWNSPALLLRSFWARRVEEARERDARHAALQKISGGMVAARRPVISAKEIAVSAEEARAVRELRSEGVLDGPALRHGMLVGEEALRFSHHLLHDYAIARTLIPALPERLCDYVAQNPLTPIFYRQSFLFALEELWDQDASRQAYWQTTAALEAEPSLHGVSRIAGPILAARRVESIADLEPLLKGILSAGDAPDSGFGKALRHLGAGLPDAETAALRAGSSAWCTFAERLSELPERFTYIETPLVHIIARLDGASVAQTEADRLTLNVAARTLLRFYLKKPVNKGWAYAALVAIEAICHTFTAAAAESEGVFLEMMAPNRVAEFPHDELFRLAHQLEHLGPAGERVIEHLFACAFGLQPEYGKTQQFGTAILPMTMQLTDHWHSVRYALAEFYQKHAHASPTLAARLTCIVANAAASGESRGFHHRHHDVISTLEFRGRSCELIEDLSHVWATSEYPSDQDAAGMVRHFSTWLKGWAETGNASLDAILDIFAERSRTAWLWSVAMEAGAEFPSTLGLKLAAWAENPLVLAHMDYCYAATKLFAALHRTGDATTRARMERIVLQLTTLASDDESARPMYRREILEHTQNRLLGALDEANLALPGTAQLLRSRREADALVENRERRSPRAGFVSTSPEERLAAEGVKLRDKTDRELFRLREALKQAFPDDRAKLTAAMIERNWSLLRTCERAVRRAQRSHAPMAAELWGHVVIVCSNAVHCAEWPARSLRWQFIRSVLVRAADDPVPAADTKIDPNHSMPFWGVPSPRVDAARGLPMLMYRLAKVDRVSKRALEKLSRDPSLPVRLNLADHLTALWQPAPDLMWRLIDTIIEHEPVYCVLVGLDSSVSWLLHKQPDQALRRLAGMAQRAEGAAPDHNLHEHLAATHLFHFLRTGDAQCEAYVRSLIAECEMERARHALLPLLHHCRSGGWLTTSLEEKPTSEAEAHRKRTWKFLHDLLLAAREKLRSQQAKWDRDGPFEGEALKQHQAVMKSVMLLIDGVAMQLYFASGAFDEKRQGQPPEEKMDAPRTARFWQEAKPVFQDMVTEWHPHTIYHVVQALEHLLPYGPREAFLLAAQAIRSSARAGFQHESLAVTEVVKLIQRALADHREIFQVHGEARSDCLEALLEVLDLFVEAGWPEPRQLTYRLEEIYR